MRNPMRTAIAALAISLGLAGAASPAAARVARAEAAEPASETVTEMADWVIASGDNDGLPFMIIDKVAAEVFVFGPHGRARGAAPALLGLARGDGSAAGVGDRRLSAIRPKERTTPAGRFIAGFGPAAGKRKVLWVDYATAISIHPVVTANPKEQRAARLKSPSPQDNRITFGCINVSASFYENVVRKTFTGTKGVVYILPETKPMNQVFPAFQLQARASPAPTGEPEEAPGAGSSRQARNADAASSRGADAALVQ